jgi:hypothetical protein
MKLPKALRKTDFSKLFIASFGNVQLGNFSEKLVIFEFAKPCFLRQKQLVWGQKQGFPNIPNLQKFQILLFSQLSENYKK